MGYERGGCEREECGREGGYGSSFALIIVLFILLIIIGASYLC
ncbi:YjcZ family sporulation protein [Sporosarcina sp. G11-34]|nr:YjcZ family sporulation protein [Sporosarcina sp. G11-34]MCZ2260504.1 YjcZ family sporulation protein [Sporosarcina sp. G11-34]